MRKIEFLDLACRSLLTLFKTDEQLIGSDQLDSLIRSACAFRFRTAEQRLEKETTECRFLFRNIELVELAEESKRFWLAEDVTQIVDSALRGPIILAPEDSGETWMNHPDVPRVKSAFANLPVDLWQANDEYTPVELGGTRYAHCFLVPEIPEWYFFRRDLLPEDERTREMVLEMAIGSYSTMRNDVTIEAGEVRALFYVFFTSMLPKMAKLEETRKPLITMWGTLEALGVSLKDDDFISKALEIPRFYQEFLLLLFDEATNGTILPQLVRELGRMRAEQ